MTPAASAAPSGSARNSASSPSVSGIVSDPATLTPTVLRAMANSDSRLAELMASLVAHLHAFVRETGLTEEEYQRGLAFLAALGQATGPEKNEVVLMADVLGVSTLVALQNSSRTGRATASAVLGPFWRKNAPRFPAGASIARGNTPGVPLFVSGQVLDGERRPVAGADVDVWQASPVGFYENQDPDQPDMNLRGVLTTDHEGRYHFETVRPAGYPVPTDGPVGELLRAQHRHAWRPAHLHFMISAPGFRTLVTQVFADEDEALHRDVVFAVLEPLVGDLKESVDADGRRIATLSYDFTLEPGEQRFPMPPLP